MRRIFLALLGPSLTIGVFVAWITQPADTTTTPAVSAMDAALAEAQPDFVSVGPSVAGRDIDFKALARRLGLEQGAALTMDGSGPAHWYAMLKYRLFDAGYRPKLVLIVAPLKTTLRAGLLNTKEVATLVQHFEAPDAVLGAKALGYAHSPVVERVMQRRAGLSRSVLDPVRGAIVGLIFAPNHSPDGGLAVQTEAATSVFREGSGQLGAARVLPGVEEEQPDGATDAGGLAGILPDLLDLIRASGARAVVVRVPLSEHVRSYDQLTAAEERAAIVTINAHGAGYLDLRESSTSNSDFGDPFHLNRVGRARFTEALGGELERIGALGDLPIAAAKLPLVASLTREGAPPPLPSAELEDACHGRVPWPDPGFAALAALGLLDPAPLDLSEDGALLSRGRAADAGCNGVWTARPDALAFSAFNQAAEVQPGLTLAPPDDPEDAWWIAPGTSLKASFSSDWAGGAFVATAAGVAVGVGAAPRLSVNGAASVAFGGVGEALTAQVTTAPPPGAWALRVEVPAGGAWFALRSLEVGEGASRLRVAGPPVHDRTLTRAEFQCSGAVPLPAATLHPGAQPWLDVPGLVVTGEALDLAANQPGPAPFEVTQDGVALTRGRAPAPGTYAILDGQIRLDPTNASGTLRVLHSAERLARFGRWLLPGETCVLDVEPRHSRFPVRSVMVSAMPAGADTGGLHVRLEDDAGVLLDETAPWATFRALARFKLPGWRAKPFRLVLSLDASAPYVFVRSVAVTDSSDD
ncbi:hypothetical protein LBMAG42_21810 [Deltaproteobacteria bacterium]|nr:hypothetical protein LBMAG42_21810 [Deltaproteobacteria bacterium]